MTYFVLLVCGKSVALYFGKVIIKLSSRPKLGRMEETRKGGRDPPWAIAPLERERIIKLIVGFDCTCN
jgi:hypothetical protein